MLISHRRQAILEALKNCFSKFAPKISASHVAANIQLSGHIPLFCSEALKIDLKQCGTSVYLLQVAFKIIVIGDLIAQSYGIGSLKCILTVTRGMSMPSKTMPGLHHQKLLHDL